MAGRAILQVLYDQLKLLDVPQYTPRYHTYSQQCETQLIDEVLSRGRNVISRACRAGP